MERWFCSDHHFWHDNIIKYAGRPFGNALEMNEALVEYHNAFVKPEDHVYFLGDLTMRRGGKEEREEFVRLCRSLRGHKTLFLGNHDHWPTKVYLDAGFETVRATWRDQEGIIYSHIPLHPTSLNFGVVANVHGHIHQNESPPPAIAVDKEGKVYVKPYVNVCMEWTGYRPITLGELKDLIRKQVENGKDTEVRTETTQPTN
jgi:calcineurin-like phosphoesterase family protein